LLIRSSETMRHQQSWERCRLFLRYESMPDTTFFEGARWFRKWTKGMKMEMDTGDGGGTERR